MKFESITKITLVSFFINLAFAIYNCILGFMSHSWWFITLSAYYIILSVMRFAALQIKRNEKNDFSAEIFAKRFSGVMFIFLSICLAGTTILSSTNNRGIKHNEIFMITIALYAFTKVTLGIINLVKSRKYSSPIFKTLRYIAFVDALVSLFSLQRSMLVTFEGTSLDDIKFLNVFTGSAVCLTVFILGINLIKGKNEHGKIKNS